MVRLADVLSSSSKEIAIQSPLDFLQKSGYIQIVDNQIIYLPLFTKILSNLEKVSLNYFSTDQIILATPQYLQFIVEFHLQSYKRLPKVFAIRYTRGKPSPNLWTTESQLLSIYSVSESEQSTKLTDLWLQLDVKPVTVHNHLITEYAFLHTGGQNRFAYCSYCERYDAFESVQYSIPMQHGAAQPMKKIYTPNTRTIDGLCDYLQITPEQTAKIVFYKLPVNFSLKPSAELLICVVRGDRHINEQRLRSIIQLDKLLMADEPLILDVGAFPGFASPIGIASEKCYVLVDPSVEQTANLVAGANEEHYHLLHTNYGRDYVADQIVLLADPIAGDACTCGHSLSYLQGTIIAAQHSVPTPSYAPFMNKDGKPQSYAIQQTDLLLQRIFAAYVETHTDDYGLLMSKILAPYDVHIVVLGNTSELRKFVQDVLMQLDDYIVLLDDRDAKAGEKFADADLIGIPIRVVVSIKLMKDKLVEIKLRTTTEKQLIALSDLKNHLQTL